MKKLLLLYFMALMAVFISCTNNEKGDVIADENQEEIYFDYRIKGREGDDNLNLLLRYRYLDEEGDTYPFSSPAKVLLDGVELMVDSSKMSGNFYEVQKPITTFSGMHTISLVTSTGKEYKEEFSFYPLQLLTQIPDTIPKDTLYFQFEGVEKEDFIRVLMLDTSFYNDGINKLDTVKNGQFVIPKEILKPLANGPIQLEFVREYERPVKNGTVAGGIFRITYTLQREFVLKD